MATVTITLDKRRRRGDGTFALKIGICHRGRSANIPLSLYIHPDQWDRKKRMVINHPHKQALNQTLAQRLAETTAVVMDLSKNGKFAGLTITQVRDLVESKINPVEAVCGEFISRWDNYTKRKQNARTSALYKATRQMMESFDPAVIRYSFADITRSWLESFDVWLMKRGNKTNSRAIHLRNIRAVFNDALDDGLAIAYPFRRMTIKQAPTRKRSLTPAQLRMVFNADVEDWQQKYIDAFKLSFLLIGINAVDLLTTSTIVGDRLEYDRAKTHRHYSVKIEPEAMEIINRYPSTKGHLIGLADGCSWYHHIVHRWNKALKAVMPGVTTYWARHSWATIAASLDIPRDTIAHALGHGGNTVTDIYIDYDQSKVDDANRRVIDWVLYQKKDPPQS